MESREMPKAGLVLCTILGRDEESQKAIFSIVNYMSF